MASKGGPPQSQRPGGPAGLVIAARERLNAAILPVARAIGFAGLVALVVLVVALQVPEDNLPAAYDDHDRIALHAMIALCTASLLGWGCMQLGMRRVRGAVGWRLGGYLFVLGPILCATLNLLVGDGRWLAPAQVPFADVVLPFVRFYPPTIVSACLLAFIGTSGEEKDGTAKVASGALAVFMVLPYALLIAVLAFGIEVEWLNDTLEETLDDLGQWALVVQVVLAFFVGGAGPG